MTHRVLHGWLVLDLNFAFQELVYILAFVPLLIYFSHIFVSHVCISEELVCRINYQ